MPPSLPILSLFSRAPVIAVSPYLNNLQQVSVLLEFVAVSRHGREGGGRLVGNGTHMYYAVIHMLRFLGSLGLLARNCNALVSNAKRP